MQFYTLDAFFFVVCCIGIGIGVWFSTQIIYGCIIKQRAHACENDLCVAARACVSAY